MKPSVLASTDEPYSVGGSTFYTDGSVYSFAASVQ